jgi:hypothetical protein
LIADGVTVAVVEESLAASEQDRHDGQLHLVDQASVEVLLDGGRPAAKPHVHAVGRVDGSLEAASMPSLTQWSVVLPCIVIDAWG